MELFFAQNHAPLTHLPIATSILAAGAAIAGLFSLRKELSWAWSFLTIIAFVTVIPTIMTGIQAGRGRQFIEKDHYLVSDAPDNSGIKLHQQLGLTGAIIALVSATLGFLHLRGKKINKYFSAIVALTVALLWGIGGHLGGKELWSPETFPAFEQVLPNNSKD